MMARVLIACWLAGAGVAAADTPDTRAARFYAAGLERPLLQLRAGTMLVAACKGSLRRGCDEQQVRLAADNQLIALLDSLSLFPQRPEADPAARIGSARELRQRIAEASELLMREAGQYDRQLFARYGAALTVCPPDDAAVYAGSVEKLMLINLRAFQALTSRVAEVSAEVRAEQARIEERLRREPLEDCLAARRLGEYLMQLMDSKLQPWNKPYEPAGGASAFNFDEPVKESRKPTPGEAEDRQLARAVAGNFVTVVATELQLLVFPESAARIKQIAEQVGFPEY